MAFQTVIAPALLAAHLADPQWVIVDCRFELDNPEAGRQAYEAAHIPGARYAHLDEVLTNPPYLDHGRHPLPAPDVMALRIGELGIGNDSQVVAYDDAGGAYAARLWWMLRYLGHEAVAVLDGGWQGWLAADYPISSEPATWEPTTFHGEVQRRWLVTVAEVPSAVLLVDSRAPQRYRGEVEPIDPVAGHIPGAVNYPYSRNLDRNGRFLPPERLRAQLTAIHGDTAPEEVTYYCGSGVTACHNLLAQAHAGLPPGRLYSGSWSDWIRDPQRPVSRSQK